MTGIDVDDEAHHLRIGRPQIGDEPLDPAIPRQRRQRYSRSVPTPCSGASRATTNATSAGLWMSAGTRGRSRTMAWAGRNSDGEWLASVARVKAVSGSSSGSSN